MSNNDKVNNLYVTNDYSIVSKYSAIKNGYFIDNILTKLVEETLNIKSWKRTPLVNRGYAARLLAVDWIVNRSVKHDLIDCFIVLGAGYDTLPYRKDKRETCWIEIDLPHVIENKVKFLRNHLILGETVELVQLEEGLYLSTSKTNCFISCDLTNLERLTHCLDEIIPKVGSRKRHFAILNEVCLCYLDKGDVTNVLRVIIKSVCCKLAFRVHYIGYEQVKPKEKSPFDRVMLEHFSSLGYPLKHYPTSQELMRLFLNDLDFQHLTVASMFQIYHNALMTDRLDIELDKKEPFDEFEEMDLYLAHYALVTGVLILKDPFLTEHTRSTSQSSSVFEDLTALSFRQESGFTFKTSSSSRFGHSSCLLEDNVLEGKICILISGGFGKDSLSSKHQKLSSINILTIDQSSSILETDVDVTHVKSKICLDRMHGQVEKVTNEGLVFFNGGRRSPKKNSPGNINFIANLYEAKLTIRHQFDIHHTESNLCWRHRLTSLQDDKMTQVGGIGYGKQTKNPVLVWNMSSSKLGFTIKEFQNQEMMDRHSFAMDMKDINTLFLFGGLQTSLELRDQPIDGSWNAVLWDMRAESPIKVSVPGDKYYGSNIHFINSFQFINVGGILINTGLGNANVELYDLRNNGCLLLNEKSIGFEKLLLTNFTSCHTREKKSIVTIGGGGNYFTFGTHFNEHHLLYVY